MLLIFHEPAVSYPIEDIRDHMVYVLRFSGILALQKPDIAFAMLLDGYAMLLCPTLDLVDLEHISNFLKNLSEFAKNQTVDLCLVAL